MKKFLLLSTIIFGLLTTGCSNNDTMENIEIYTTNYPIEYITNRLYGDHSTIYSIYPDGVIIDKYKLTNKQIKDYSKADLYIYNGLSNEKNYIEKLKKHNKKLKIIDTTISMESSNEYEELWLDPSNFLMMAQNIKSGFEEYTSNYYLNNDISDNYEKLKIEASNLDAKIKQTVKNSSNNTIIASSDLFKYLEKYGLTVYSLEENENLTDKVLSDVQLLINNGKVNYIFVKNNEDINDTVKDLIEQTGIEKLEFNTLSNLSEKEKNNNEDYFSIMNSNIDLLKNELYD